MLKPITTFDFDEESDHCCSFGGNGQQVMIIKEVSREKVDVKFKCVSCYLKISQGSSPGLSIQSLPKGN